MMIVKLKIMAEAGGQECEYNFSMAGRNRDRAIEYARKTARRRWAKVEWFTSMEVWISPDDENWTHVADITTDVSAILTDRRE